MRDIRRCIIKNGFSINPKKINSSNSFFVEYTKAKNSLIKFSWQIFDFQKKMTILDTVPRDKGITIYE